MLPPNSTLLLVQFHSGFLAPADLAATLDAPDLATAHSDEDVCGIFQKRAVELVLIDAAQSGGEAWRCGSRIRETAARVPIVFITAGEPSSEFFERLAAIAPADYLPADAVPHLLRSKIAMWLALVRSGGTRGREAGAPRLPGDATSQLAERFQLLLDASPDYGLFYLDTAGVIREWTRNAEKLFGYTADEVVGEDLGFFYSAEERAAGVPARELAAAARGEQARAERWFTRKNGTRFYASGRLLAMREGGELRGFVQIVRDATLRKEAELKLREALDRFQTLADNISQLAWMADPSGSRFWFNKRWFDYTGVTLEEARGWGWCKIVHPYHLEAARRLVVESAASGQAFEHTVPLRGRSGEYRWFLCQAAPIKDAAGNVLRWFGTSTDTNDDVVLRQKLSASEEKFREIFATANEGIWVVDGAGRIEIANRRMAELLGCEPEELVGRPKTDFAFPEDRERFRHQIAERRLRSAMSVELRFQHSSGREVWTLMSSRPLLRAGVFAGALEMFTDVTARKVVERALRSSEAEFRAFFESAAGGHAFVDPRTQRFQRVNPRFVEMTGYPVAELERLTLLDLTHPDDRRDDEPQRRQLARGEITELTTEKRYVRKNGGTFWAQVTSTLLCEGEGRPQRQLCVMQDTTGRKVAELELAQRSTHLRLAVDAAELGTFFSDVETGEHVWNDQNKILLGLPVDTKPSMEAFLERVHPDDRAGVERKLRLVARARPPGREFTLQYRVVWPDGSLHHLAARGRSLRERRRNGTIATRLIGTARDVTAMMQFEDELRRQVAQRTAALQERTEQLEAFSYTVAHDLRSPIRAISGYAEILATDFTAALQTEGALYLEKIQRSAERMDGLIGDLLAFTRVVQMRVVTHPVALQHVVNDVLAELRDEIARRQAQVEVESPLPIVRAERTILEQIMLNLVTNALKFVAPGVAPRVTISTTETARAVTVRIADNGLGIPVAYHERIFRVFERLETSRDYPGTGVGLAIVAKAVERLGGRVGLTSQPGQGSTFWFELEKPEA